MTLFQEGNTVSNIKLISPVARCVLYVDKIKFLAQKKNIGIYTTMGFIDQK